MKKAMVFVHVWDSLTSVKGILAQVVETETGKIEITFIKDSKGKFLCFYDLNKVKRFCDATGHTFSYLNGKKAETFLANFGLYTDKANGHKVRSLEDNPRRALKWSGANFFCRLNGKGKFEIKVYYDVKELLGFQKM